MSKRKVEDESMASYKKRLNLTARRLPRRLIQKCVGKMKENLRVTKKSAGGQTHLD